MEINCIKANLEEEEFIMVKNNDELSQEKVDEMKAKADANEEVKSDKEPASDLYGTLEGKEEGSNVEIPTDHAVEDAKEWVDNENIR